MCTSASQSTNSIFLGNVIVRLAVLAMCLIGFPICVHAQSNPCPPGMIPGQGGCYSPTEVLYLESTPVYEDRFGAIAFQDDAFGNRARASYGAESEEQAKGIALEKCGDHCKIVYVIRNQCMAVAEGVGKLAPVELTASTSMERAVKRALKQCRKNGGVDCSIKHQSCSYAQRVR